MFEIMWKAGENVKIKTEQNNPAALGRRDPGRGKKVLLVRRTTGVSILYWNPIRFRGGSGGSMRLRMASKTALKLASTTTFVEVLFREG